MRLVTYTFRGTTRTGAMLDEHDVVDLNRAETFRLRQAGNESPEGRTPWSCRMRRGGRLRRPPVRTSRAGGP